MTRLLSFPVTRAAFCALVVSLLSCLSPMAEAQQQACCSLNLPTVAQQDALNPRIYETIFTNGPTSYGQIFLNNVPPGFSITNGVGYLAWCIDSFHYVSIGGTYFPRIYCSFDTAGLMSEGIPTANWDRINYILNHKPPQSSTTGSDVQDAIWHYINGGGPSQTDLESGALAPFGLPAPNPVVVAALIADADLNGGGFTPSPGGVIAIVMALPVSLNGGTQFQPFIIEVPCCPACVDPALGLGAATGCTVLELANHNVSITGPAGGILGNICIAPNGALSMTGDEFITGTVKLGPGAKFTNSSHSSPTVMMNVNLSAEIAAANARASSAAALPPTQMFGTLDGKTVNTITGVAGINVIKVTDINLSGKQITLTGPPGTKFIVNVTGKFVLTGGGNGPQIRAGSGVQPKDILYNIIGSGSDVTFSGGGGGVNCCAAIVDGTLLAPQRKISLAPGLVNGQIISGLDISIVSGSSVRCPRCQ